VVPVIIVANAGNAGPTLIVYPRFEAVLALKPVPVPTAIEVPVAPAGVVNANVPSFAVEPCASSRQAGLPDPSVFHTLFA
jgi:hypothetical protein